jgi:hypothetical protein
VKGNIHARFLGGRGRINRLRLPGAHSHVGTATLTIMKGILEFALIVGLAGGGVAAEPKLAETKPAETQKASLTKFNRQIIDKHSQKYGVSCIPSSVEMVLKLLGRVLESYCELQDAWKEKTDGTFGDFHDKTIKGVTFHRQFDLPRNDQFPLSSLFETIDRELKAGRYVIASLPSDTGYHMYVIYDEDRAGDFLAVSKLGTKTTELEHLKDKIKGMKGTDIMTYEVRGESP